MNADTPERFARQRRWFHQLVESAPHERAALLDQIGHDDPSMRDELARLLAHAGDGAETRVSTADVPAPVPDDDASPGQLPSGTAVADRYRIDAPLGVGGMGEVYLARRIDDTGQRVAIKLIRNDAIGNADRFVRERRILARLQHRNIAHLIDAGVTASGRPWFALELVEGERITHWCDTGTLDLRERARLFLRVCDAVQYAHRNLVLHRDLKPSNILVTAAGEPKLLDFGIAKPIDDDSGDMQHTRTLAFTPAYAAPEQLRGEPTTTSSDTYQLGLILFELCTGVPARDPRGGGDTTVPRPDSAVTRRSDEVAEKIARLRGTSRERLIRTLRGDLGRIVAHAVADDPQERYASASELADDLQCWLDDRPVRAHRGSAGYRLRKFLRRNRLATGAAAVALLALLIGTAGIAWQYGQARMHAQQATQIKDFLLELFNDADPDASGGAQVTVREVLDRGAARLEHGQLSDTLRGEFSNVLADLYRRLGLYERSRALVQARLAQLDAAPSPPAERRAARLALAQVLTEAAQLDEADAALAVLENDPGYPDTGPERIALMALRGLWHQREGQYAQATDFQRRALTQTRERGDALDIARAQVRLASVLTEADALDEAETLLQSATATLENQLGENHSDVARALEELSSVRFHQGDVEGALEAAERMLAITTRLYGETHSNTLMAAVQRAALLRNLARMDEALAMLEDILPQLEAREGDKALGHLAEALVQRATTYLRTGRGDEARRDAERAIDLYENHDVRNVTSQAMGYVVLANLAIGQGGREEALALMSKARDLVQSAHGINAARTAMTVSHVASLVSRPDPKETERTLHEALVTATQQFGPDHFNVGMLTISLGAVLAVQERFEDAIIELERGIAIYVRLQRPREQNLADIVFIMGVRLRAFAEMQLHQRPPPPDILDLLPEAVAAIQKNPMLPPPAKATAALTLAEAMAMSDRAAESRAALDTARAWLPELSEDDALALREDILRIEDLL